LCALETPARISLDRFLSQYASERLTLDIGCGVSRYRNLFPNRWAIDVRLQYGVDVCADAHALPFQDESFEIVLCTEVLEHVHNPQVMIDEAYRVLKRGGRCILSTRFCYPIHDAPNDLYRFTRYGLGHLFEKWKIELLQEDTGELIAISTLLHFYVFKLNGVLGFLLKAIWLPLYLFQRKVFRTKYVTNCSKNRLFSSGYQLVAVKI
jgi:SAM-dependent methyltransferase